MTRIELYKTVIINEGVSGFTVIISGHSGYEKQGKDIVCASISTLAQFFLGLEKKTDRLNFYHISDAFLQISTCITAGNIDVIDTLVDSFMQIAEQYPEYVNIEVYDE